MSYSYPIWIDYSRAILGHSPLLSLKESKTDGVMMGQDKTRLNQVELFLDSDIMKIDRILCLNDSELC